MEPQGTEFAAAAPAIVPPLRPLSTGEVLDRTFALYRSHFWLFAAISALPAMVLTISSAVRLIILALRHQPQIVLPGAGPDAVVRAMSAGFAAQIYLLPGTLLFVVVYGMAHAATIAAVQHLTEQQATTAAAAYRQTRSRWKRWIGVILWQFWSLFWPGALGVAALFGGLAIIVSARAGATGSVAMIALAWLLIPAGLVLGVVSFLRNALAMPAAVQEDLSVRAAIHRSRALVAGRKGRIFLALILVYALQTVFGGIQVPLVYLALATHGAHQVMLQAAQLIVQFVLTVLISPVASIALCLLYVDERVRREGYDIELLMQRTLSASGHPVHRASPAELPA